MLAPNLEGWHPLLWGILDPPLLAYVSLLACDGFLQFVSGVTHANIFAANMAVNLFPTYFL